MSYALGELSIPSHAISGGTPSTSWNTDQRAQFAEAVRRGFFSDTPEGRDSYAYWSSGAGKLATLTVAGQGSDWAYQWWAFLNWWNNRSTGLSGQAWANLQTKQGFFQINRLSAAKLAEAVKTVWGQTVTVVQPTTPVGTSTPFNQGQLPKAAPITMAVTQVVVDGQSVSPGVFPALAKRVVTINAGNRQQVSATPWVKSSGNVPASSATDTFEVYWLLGMQREIDAGTVSRAWYDWDNLLRLLGLSSSSGGTSWFGKPPAGGAPVSSGSPQVTLPQGGAPSGSGGSLTPINNTPGDGAIQTSTGPGGTVLAGAGSGLLGLLVIGAVVGMAMKKRRLST